MKSVGMLPYPMRIIRIMSNPNMISSSIGMNSKHIVKIKTKPNLNGKDHNAQGTRKWGTMLHSIHQL